MRTLPRGTSMLSRGFLLWIVLLSWCGRLVVAQGEENLDVEQIAQKDLYAVLELEAGATGVDVKAAYRKLARQWHPDKNLDDVQAAQSKFAEIAEAYEVLSDDSSRRLYDHARRLRAAHANGGGNNSGGGSGGGATGGGVGGWGGEGMGGEWYFADGMDDAFGSSFGRGFGEAFGGSGAFGGEGGGGAGGGAGNARGGRGGFEFRARDPMELFEAFFGGGVFDGSEDEYWQDQEYYQQQQKQQQHQQQQFYQEMPWIGQDFEQYHDYEDAGEMYRRVITTVVYGDGTSRSTAQDYLLDRASDRWHVASAPFEYHGPGVGRSFGGVGGGRGDETVDNVLRMNEFLRVGHSITSVDRKFTAVLDHTCNFAVVRNMGPGMDRAKVWETGSFEAEGQCFAMIQDNGMFVVMAGVDPSAPGNVLWSNNQGYVGWFRQNSFHAAVLPNGNLVVSQGESPMHPAARSCVWGAFGCPGEGGVMEWKLVWISFRSKAGMVWCKVVGCGDDGQNKDGGGYRNDSSDYSSSAYSKWWGGHGKGAPAAILKRAASQGVAYLKEAWGKVKAAAEETADAASRPRHW